MPYLLAFLSAAGYGLNSFCVQMGMRSGRATSAQALIVGLLTGNIVLGIVTLLYYYTSGLPQLNWYGMLFFIASGLTAPFLGRIFNIQAIRRIGSTRTATFRVSDTFFTMLLATVLLHDVVTWNSLLGAVLLVTGVVILIKERNREELKKPGTWQGETAAAQDMPGKLPQGLIGKLVDSRHIGAVFALTSAFLMAVGGIFRNMGINEVPSAILGAMVASFVALISNFALTYFSGQLGKGWEMPRRAAFFFGLGGLGSAAGMLMFFLALEAGGSVSMVAALKNTSPLITLALSWIYLRRVERFTPKLYLSILLVLCGACLIS